jgi:multiple sugar transport system ATP-binding protein
LREALSGWVGRQVVLGIRPEHFHLEPVEDESRACPIRMKLVVIEPLGKDMDVYMQTNLNDRPVVARVEATAKVDSPVTMFVDLRKAHFFEPGETGMNLSLPQGFSSELTHALA